MVGCCCSAILSLSLVTGYQTIFFLLLLFSFPPTSSLSLSHSLSLSPIEGSSFLSLVSSFYASGLSSLQSFVLLVSSILVNPRPLQGRRIGDRRTGAHRTGDQDTKDRQEYGRDSIKAQIDTRSIRIERTGLLNTTSVAYRIAIQPFQLKSSPTRDTHTHTHPRYSHIALISSTSTSTRIIYITPDYAHDIIYHLVAIDSQH